MTFNVMKASNRHIYFCIKYTTMTKVNLILTKYLTGEKVADNNKFKAVITIKELLEQIDLKAETVPENNFEMFTRLLISLKGEPLNKDEIELVNEIVMY